MFSCPYCQSQLTEPLPSRCPACGGDLQALGAPSPPPAVPEGPPADTAETSEPWRSAQGADAPPHTGGFQPPPLPPPGPGAPGGTSGSRFVWDDRDRVGLGQAFLETSRQVLTAPTAFYRSMPVTGGLGSPLLYALIAGWLGLAAAAVYQAIWVTIVGPTQLPFAVGRPELAELFAFFESWTGLVAQLVFGGISVVISVFVASGVLHVMLLILGGARQGFEATLRVVSFAQAPSLLLLLPFFLLPFCGLLLVVWSLALYAIGLAQAQQAGGGRAAAAVLLPILALCCCCSAALLTFAGAIASLVSHAR